MAIVEGNKKQKSDIDGTGAFYTYQTKGLIVVADLKHIQSIHIS